MKQLIAVPFLVGLLSSPVQAAPRCEAGELLSEELEPRSRELVIRVTRLCRDGVCVRVRRILEVEDGERDGRPVLPELDAPRPRLAPRRAPRVQAPAPELDPEPAPPPAPASRSAANCGSALESAALALANSHRASLGLSTLRCDPVALKVARAHGQDMCERGYFSHTSPEGKQPWDRLRAAGARFQSAGENIASGYASAAEVHAGWLASPGHRANIERAGMTRAAVGVVDCGGSLVWTQLFLR